MALLEELNEKRDETRSNNDIRRNVRRRILVVDDMPLYIKVAANILAPYYEILSTSSGGLAMQVLARTFIDLVLLDVEMPVMSGIDMFGKMKEDSRFNSIPVVFFTSDNDSEMVEKAIRMGAKGYVVKPFAPNALLSKVQHILGQAHNDQAALFLKHKLKTIAGFFNEEKYSEAEEIIKEIPFDEFSNAVNLKFKRLVIAIHNQDIANAAEILKQLIKFL